MAFYSEMNPGDVESTLCKEVFKLNSRLLGSGDTVLVLIPVPYLAHLYIYICAIHTSIYVLYIHLYMC